MRNLILLVFALAIFSGCKKTPEYNIHGTINGATNEMVYMIKLSQGERIIIDSVAMENGIFKFSGSENVPQVYFIRIENQRPVIELFIENSDITISADLESPNKATITGSSVHDEYDLYLDRIDEFNKKIEDAYYEYFAAKEAGNTYLARQIEETKALPLREERIDWQKEFISSNPASYVSPYILYRQLAFVLTLDEFEELVNGLSEEIFDSPYVILMRNNIETLRRVDVGKSFVDFTLPDTTGKEISLSSLIGNGYVLVNFWASWCGPCRRKNPHNVSIYNDFNDKGFRILGVAFDKKKEDWIQAIHQDGITWPQVSDLKGWASAAGKLYGVRSIPHTVLIDPNGIIIAKDLSPDDLRAKLSELIDN